MDELEKKITERFTNIKIGDSNIVDAEVIHQFTLDGKKATVFIDPVNFSVQDLEPCLPQIKDSLLNLDEIDEVDIKLNTADKTESPQPNKAKAASNSGYLKEYKYVIAVASGKGGVGKSTVAANLAISLHKLGNKVSLFDADVYGPSIPLLFGELNTRPGVNKDTNSIIPISKYGIDFLSMGNLINPEDSVVWRGPMVHQAIEQILRDTAWSGGDYMILDLPPGTGDVQITLSQALALTGAVIVCTPQDVALLDARKAMQMFDKVNVPVMGMIENMSSFICPKCKEVTPIFGKGGVKEDSNTFDLPFLGEIPIELDVRICGDKGTPITEKFPGAASSQCFFDIAKQLQDMLEPA